MIKRVTHAVGHGLSPLLEFVPIRSVTGNELLRDTVGTQSTPLIVVTAKPQLCYGTEFVILSYLLRIKMAVIIYDWQSLCMVMKQMFSGF
jgi:hypothetical protein